MLTLLKGSAVVAGVLAATVTGVVFAQTGQGSASGITVSAGAPLGGSGAHHRHHGHHGHHGTVGQGSGSACVTPGERAQAAADNAQAGNRVALLSLWISDWTPPPSKPQQNCSGGVCTTTEGGWDGPNIQINGDHFNYGPVVLEIRRNDGTVL